MSTYHIHSRDKSIKCIIDGHLSEYDFCSHSSRDLKKSIKFYSNANFIGIGKMFFSKENVISDEDYYFFHCDKKYSKKFKRMIKIKKIMSKIE